MKIEISSNTIFDFHYKQFLKSNKHHIISFDIDSQSTLDKFMNLFIIDSLFSHLESLVLNSISTYKLLIIRFYLKSLPYLSSLSICLNNCSHDLGDIYQIIFHLSLKYFRVAVPRHPHLCITIPIAAQNQFSSIEYLLIYHRCTFNQLTSILLHTPRLSHLHCFNIIESKDQSKSELMIKLHNLTHLTMTLYNLEFDELEEFLLKLCSQLQLFHVKIESRDRSYLNADRWERFISQNMPSLIKFIFRYTDTIDDEFELTFYHSLINRFSSSFWIDRKWVFKLFIEEDELIYSIRPYQLSNSALCQQMDLSIRDKIIFNAFLNMNKISKITLQNVTENDQIESIFKYFPRLHFFGLERVRDANLKSVIRYILWNIADNNISHAMTICIFCDDAKYNKIEKLYQMIDLKKLLKNYTIRRQYDRFYIQWK
ncbi:unnamed protein product [Rotaria magnacalcarata]